MATAPKSLMEQAQELTARNRIEPVTQEFDESRGVAGRVASLTSQDSPLMQQARTRGLQTAASRGLTNSSLAAQAAQEAVIGAATPIASADAGLYQQQSLTNQTARNTANTNNAQIGATLGGQALGLENSNQQQTRALEQSESQFGRSLAEQTAQRTQQQQQFEAGQTLTREMFGSDEAFRQAQLAQQQQQFAAGQTLTREQMAQQGSQFAQNLAQQQQQIDTQISQFAQQFGLDAQGLQLQRDQLSQQDRQFLDNLTMQRDQIAQQQRQFDVNAGQNQQQINNQASQFGQSLAEQAAQRVQQQRQFEQQQAFQAAQAGMDRENQVKLAEMDSAWRNEVSSNETISQAWQQMSVNITNIQNNYQLDDAAKRTQIQNQMDSFAGYAAFWKKVTGGTADVSDLLNFQLPPAPPPPPPPASPPPWMGPPGIDGSLWD